MAKRTKNLFSFRKRVKVLPGITLNLSRSGVSTTLGVKGASINIGKKGIYLNTGIPGTGIYNRQKITSFSEFEKDNLSINIDSYGLFFKKSKSRVKASWIAFFTGFLGGHKFYLGQYFQGAIALLLIPTGLSFLWWIIDVLRFGLMSDERFFLKYNAHILQDIGVDIDSIDRNSLDWYLFIANGRAYASRDNYYITVFKIFILFVVAWVVFLSVTEKNEDITKETDNSLKYIPSQKECDQISKDLFYFYKINTFCHNKLNMPEFDVGFGDKVFFDYRENINCPLPSVEESKRDSNIVENAVNKAIERAGSLKSFCQNEIPYFNKIVQKYGS